MCPSSDLATSGDTLDQAAHAYHDMSDVLPQTEIAKAAYKHAAGLLAPSILSHSIRVYLYAKALASHSASVYSTSPSKHDLLFTACLFHDIGTTEVYNGPSRFEIEGADAASTFLGGFSISEADKHAVWAAIACHTSAGIAERIGELSNFLRVAVLHDFGRKSKAWEVLEPLREGLEGRFERAGIAKVLSDAVVQQAIKRPEKAPHGTWPGGMYRAYLANPEWEGVNKGF